MLDLTTVDKELLKATKAKAGNNFLTPLCRISFPQVFEPNPKDSKYDPGKYVVTILIPPSADISVLKEAARAVAAEEWGEKLKDVKLASPFNDAGDGKYDGFEPGWTMMRVKSKNKPTIVDPDIRDSAGKFIPITEDNGESVYPGRWARVSINPFAYNEPKKGISFGLGNIMLMYHDDPLGGGRVRAESEFEAPSNYSSGGSSSTKPADAKTVNDLF